MTHDIVCFRCGILLGALSLPFGRRDECPECSIPLHVCRMCRFYDPAVAKQCLEDDAEPPHEKEKVNFCDWYEPSENAFDPVSGGEATDAKYALAALFGDEVTEKPSQDAQLQDAKDLFK
ncbi:MAG: hypothetical protein P8M18_05325 [Woeseiaceae bacterium]|nr:hypothetical protein [Woeseiaceae bacterium]